MPQDTPPTGGGRRLSLHFDFLPVRGDLLAARTLAARTLLSATCDLLCAPTSPGEHTFPLMRNYTVADGGRVFRFQLHEGLRFHDDAEVTSTDVLSSLEASLAAHADVEAFSKRNPVRAVKRLSKSKFEIQSDPAVADLPSFLAELAVPVLRKGSEGVPCGLYRVEKWTSDRIELALNASHADASEALFPFLSLVAVQESDTLATLLARRNVCVASRALAFWGPHEIDATRVLRFPSATGTVVVLALARSAAAHVLSLRESLSQLPGDAFVTFQSRWLEPLTGFFPEGHVLAQHVEASTLAQAHPAGSPSLATQEPLVVAVEDGFVPPAVLQEWQWFLSQRGTPVSFKVCQVGTARDLLAAERVDGILSGLDLTGATSSSRIEAFFEALIPQCGPAGSELGTLLRQARALTHDRGRGPQALRAFLRAMLLKSSVVPACFVPEIVLLGEGVRSRGRASPHAGIDVRALVPVKAAVDEESLRRTKLEAITATTQMFAHDVRKPFSLLRMAMDLMLRAESLGEARNITERLLPEVDKAIENVNDMIEDLMEVGATRGLHARPTDARALVRSSLVEVFASRKAGEADNDVAFRFDLDALPPLLVDPGRMQRVFSNILTNSLQALQGRQSPQAAPAGPASSARLPSGGGGSQSRAEIWVTGHTLALDTGEPLAEVTIGNSHSFIDPEELPRVFEAFYTRGKRGGTGLGLAIVEKIVREHGGHITCRSVPESAETPSFVEFSIRLPVAPSHTRPAHEEPIDLPSRSSGLVAELGLLRKPSEATNSVATMEQEARKLEETIARHLAHTEPFRLLVIDDEALYRDALTLLVARSERLRDVARVDGVEGEASLRARLGADDFEPWDLVICDIDLGPGVADGFALVRLLRERGLRCDICVHSNQTGIENYRRALEEGADVFLPKPMSRVHFLKLLEETARKRVRKEFRGRSAASRDAGGNAPRRVAVVDDNFIVLHAWKKHLPPGSVLVYSSPREFWNAVGDGLLNPSELLCVVTDHSFEQAIDDEPGATYAGGAGRDGVDTGLAFLEILEERFELPVFLQTHYEFDPATKARLRGRLLAKRPHSLEELKQRVDALGLEADAPSGR